MRFPDVYRVRNANPTGIQGIAGAAPVTLVGNPLDSGFAGGTAPPRARLRQGDNERPRAHGQMASPRRQRHDVD